MIRFSEYVSLGHPDKIADYISEYLLDRYLERDPNTRYAVEVQIKDVYVTLGGEVTSTARFTDAEIEAYVRQAVNDIGYTREYQELWGRDNTICGDDLKVTVFISQQSPDIAQGLAGWGDQGIFYGMATCNTGTERMPYEHAVAKKLCKGLFEKKLGGLDIKTQVVTDNGIIKKVIVAIPLLFDIHTKDVEEYVHETLLGNYELIVNGTGRYYAHSTVADCGTTGRKLAVDFYGGNGHLGGGSPWTKDASKADLTLNLVARWMAKQFSAKNNTDAYVSLACCIGKQEVDYCIQNALGEVMDEGVKIIEPAKMKEKLLLNTPIYASMCRWGLFGEYQSDKKWEMDMNIFN